MRWIADSDKERIEEAVRELKGKMMFAAIKNLQAVLDNMRRLEVEQPNPEPRIVELSASELEIMYPERYQDGQA